MVQMNLSRESRHVAVHGLPENLTTDKISSFFSIYGRVQKIDKNSADKSIIVSFTDVRSAQKAYQGVHKIDNSIEFSINFYEPDSSLKTGPAPIPNPLSTLNTPTTTFRINSNTKQPKENPANVFNIAIHKNTIKRLTRDSQALRASKELSEATTSSPSTSSSTPNTVSHHQSITVLPSTSSSSSTLPSSSSSSSSVLQAIIVEKLPQRSDTTLKEHVRDQLKRYGSKLTEVVIDLDADSNKRAVVWFQKIDHEKVLADQNINILGQRVRLRVAPFTSATSSQPILDPRCAPASTSSSTPSSSSTTQSPVIGSGSGIGHSTMLHSSAASSSYSRRGGSSMSGTSLSEEVDVFNPKASRTLYVGGLETKVPQEVLRKRFQKFGEILDVDVKNGDSPSPFAFLQFADIDSAVRAVNAHLTANKKGRPNFGRSTQTNKLWVGHLPENAPVDYIIQKLRTLSDTFAEVIVDMRERQAIVIFSQAESATPAYNRIRSNQPKPFIFKLPDGDHRVAADYCSDRLHDYFIDRKHQSTSSSANTNNAAVDPIRPPPPFPALAPSTSSAAAPSSSSSSSSNEPLLAPPPDPPSNMPTFIAAAVPRQRDRGSRTPLSSQQQMQPQQHYQQQQPQPFPRRRSRSRDRDRERDRQSTPRHYQQSNSGGSRRYEQRSSEKRRDRSSKKRSRTSSTSSSSSTNSSTASSSSSSSRSPSRRRDSRSPVSRRKHDSSQRSRRSRSRTRTRDRRDSSASTSSRPTNNAAASRKPSSPPAKSLHQRASGFFSSSDGPLAPPPAPPPIIGVTSQTPGTSQQQTSTAAHQILSPNKVATPAPLLSPRTSNSSKIHFNINNPPRALQHQQQPQQQQPVAKRPSLDANATASVMTLGSSATTARASAKPAIIPLEPLYRRDENTLLKDGPTDPRLSRSHVRIPIILVPYSRQIDKISPWVRGCSPVNRSSMENVAPSRNNSTGIAPNSRLTEKRHSDSGSSLPAPSSLSNADHRKPAPVSVVHRTSASTSTSSTDRPLLQHRNNEKRPYDYGNNHQQQQQQPQQSQSQSHQKSTLVLTPRLSDDEYVVEDDDDDQLGEYPPPPPSSLDMLCQPMKGFDNSFFKKKIEIFGERLHKTSTPTTPATPATPFQHVPPSTSSILPAPSTSFHHQQQPQTVAPSAPQYHPLHPISIGAAAAAAAQHHQPLPSTSGLLLSQQNSQDSTTSETGFQGGSPKRFGIKKMSGGSGDMGDIRARLSHLERQRHVNEFADFVPSAAPLTRPRASFESTKNEPTPTPLPLPPPPLSISIPPPSTSSLIQQVPQSLASTHSTSSQQPLPSPVSTSRHGSMSSTQKPASIVRTASMSYPPPPIGVITNIVTAQEPPPSSSTSMASPILSAPPPPPYIPKPTPPRRDSESSSRTSLMSPPVVASTSKPKGSETPKPYAPAANANITINTQAAAPPKQVRRHDSVSGRPVPTTPAPQGIQNRSMSESVHPKTPVGAEVISKMLNPTQPNTWGLSFKKNSNTAAAAAPGATPGPSTAQVVQKPVISAIPFVKEKSHKEKKEKKKEKEREKEKQREKEEKQRRKEKEKRREEKQRQKEKEKEEKQRRKEKEKKQQQQIKRRESSDSEEVSDEESDEESGKALTQLEQDHRLAVLLSEGTIIEKVKSRRNKVEKRKNESLEKIRQKKNSGAQSTRRILLDSSDGSAGDDNDSEASMVRESENERADTRKDDFDDDDEEETRRRIEKAKKKEKKQKKMSMNDVYRATSDDEKKKKKKKEREEKKKRKRRMEEAKDDDEDEDEDDEKDDRDVVKKRKKKKMRKESADNDEEINRFMEKFHKKNAKRRHTASSPTPSTSSQPSDAYSNPVPNTDATTKAPPSKRPAPTPHSLADLEDVSDATTVTNDDTVKNNEADTSSTPISSPAAQHVTKTTTTVPTGPPAMISPRQRYRTSSTASTSSTVGGGAEKLVSPITPKTSISSIELEEAQKTTRLLATKASVKSFDSSLVQETPIVVAPSAPEAPASEHPARPPSSADSSSSSNSDVSDSSDSEEADDAINKIEAELCKVSPGQTSSPAPAPAPAQDLEADDATVTMMSEDQEPEPVPEPEPEQRMSIFDEDDDVEPQYPSHDFIEKSANLSIDADEPESSSSSMNRPRASVSPPSRAGKDDIPDEQILEEIYCEEPVVDDDEMRDERPTPQPTSETPTKMGDYEDEQEEPLRIAPTPTPPLARVELELPPRPASVVMAPRPPSNPMIAYNNLQQQQIAQQQLAAPSTAPTTIVITDPQISTLQFIQQRNKLLAEAEAARAAQVVEQSTMPSALSSSASPAPVVASSTAQLFSPKVVTNGNRSVPTTSATPAVTVPSPVAATVSQPIKVSVPTTVLSNQSTPTTSTIRANSVYPPAFLSQQSTPTVPSTVPTTVAQLPDPVVTSAMLIHQAAMLQYIEMQAKTVRLAKEKEEKEKAAAAAAAAAARLEEKRRKEAKEKKEREEMERKKQLLLQQQQQQQLAANYQLAHQLQAQVLRQFPQFNVNERQIAQLAQHLAAVTAAAQLPVTTAAATTSTPFQPQVAAPAPAPAPAPIQIAAPPVQAPISVQAPVAVQIQAPIQVAAPVQVPVQVPVSVQAPAPVHVPTSIPVQTPTPTPSPITNGGAPLEPEKPPTPVTAEILTNGTHASPPQQNGHYVLKNLPATGLGRCQLNPIPMNVKFLDMSGGEPQLDLATLLQQLTGGLGAPAAQQQVLPQVVPNLETLLNAQLQQQQQQQLNPLAMLMQPNNPVYQNLARMLLMGQMLQAPQENPLLLSHHMSLKRNLPAPIAPVDRKRSCPPPPPPPPRSPTPPIKKMLENLSPEQKAKNEVFRKEIMRRLDVILLEELADDDEMEEKSSEPEQEPELEVDTEQEPEPEPEQTEEDSMGAAGSAFRRILSRTAESTEESGAISPSLIGSLSSSGPNSPPIEIEPLSSEMLEKLAEIAKKHREANGDRDVEEELDDAKFEKWYPLSWTGRVTMKSSETSLSLHLISGSREYLQTVLGDPDVAPQLQRKEIRINQRLRLRTEKGTNQIERLLSTEDFCCCIGVPAGLGREEVVTSREVLKTNFIDYFTDKSIAGIGTLMAQNDKQDQPCRVHLFAPADLIDGYIKKLAPNLHDRLSGNSLTYVLVIFGTQDKVDPETAAATTA